MTEKVEPKYLVEVVCGEKKMKDNKEDLEDLKELFRKIENLKDFKRWFGIKCPDYYPKCIQCKFWKKWEKMKKQIEEELGGQNGKSNN